MSHAMRRLAHLQNRSLGCKCLLVKHLSSRISAKDIALDVNLCASNPELILSHLQSRCDESNLKDNVLKLAELRSSRNSEIVASNEAKRKKHILSGQIGRLMSKAAASHGESVISEDSACEGLKLEVEGLNSFIHQTDKQIEQLNEEIKQNFMLLPNLLHDSVPDGQAEADNVVVSEWGAEARKMGEDFRWHDDLATSLGGLDLPAAVRMSGSRFSVLTGQVARLERAVTNYFLDYFTGLTEDRKYGEVSVPLIVTRSTLESTGQLPKFEDDLFKITHTMHDEDAFLIPTAEVPLTCLLRGQLLHPEGLPHKHVSSSPCFRAEAGSRGRDTRGLLRQHQFQKIELVKVCTPESSDREYAEMVSDVENLLMTLELPFRKVLLCSSDMGFSSSICHDFEVWLPGQQQYREISSVSNCGDFQSRRMGMRYRVTLEAGEGPGNGPKKVTVFPHTMNGSGLAVGRTLVAILENYQNPDGSVDVPAVLQPYMGGVARLEPPAAPRQTIAGG